MIFATDCLAGKRILVTGASSGLGRAAALLFARCGAQVAAMGRDAERLDATVTKLEGTGHVAHVGVFDDADGAADQVGAIAKDFGQLSGVFHAAGTSLVLPVKLTRDHHLDDLFAAGVRGALGVARAAAKKGVVADGGSLVFMSSVAAIRGRPGMVAYSSAKAAVDGMMRAVAAELAPRRIRANSIVAGAVETEMHEGFVKLMNDAVVDSYRDLHMLGFGQPDDIANMATFLLSDAAGWITGAAIAVDGGYTAK